MLNLSAEAGARFIRVIPFLEWCEMRGISPATGRRLISDREYLDACLRDSA
jgi:hypothetical protein